MSLASTTPTSDAITVIRTPLWFAKRIWPGRTEAHSSAKRIDVGTMPLTGLEDLAALLQQLIDDPHAAVIRGELIDPTQCRGIRRLLHQDPKTGAVPTFRDTPRRWVALDIEGIPRPPNVLATDLVTCAHIAIAQLPAAFAGTRCIIQATASHGIKPDIRLRLLFWLSRPTTGEELKRWLVDTPADPAAFGAVQPLYTARPIFMSGAVDPLPCRLAERPGEFCVQVPSPAALAPPPEPRVAVGPYEPVADAVVDCFVERTLDRVRMAPEGRRHWTLRGAARSLGGIQMQAGFTNAVAVQLLLDCLPSARDWNLARRTAEWGLANGRSRPIALRPAASLLPTLTGAIPAPAANEELLARTYDQAPRTTLPAYYPPPEPDRDAALQRQNTIIGETIVSAAKLVELRRRMHQRRADILGLNLDPTPAEKAAATRAASLEVNGGPLPKPARNMVTGSQGTGKTAEAIRAVAAIDVPMSVWICEPTHSKALEVAADYQLAAGPDSLPGMAVRGRGANDPERPGEKMCPRYEAASTVAEAGVSVFETMCLPCPLRSNCGTERQRLRIEAMGGRGVFWQASDYLYLPSPAPKPDLIVADEDVIQRGIEILTIPLSVLEPYAITRLGADTRDSIYTIRTALLSPTPLAAIRVARIDKVELTAMRNSLEARLQALTPAVDGSASDTEIIEAYAAAHERRAVRSVLALLAAIRREINAPARCLTPFNAPAGTSRSAGCAR